ncbi:MAG: YlxR family protein [Actinomycetes bacterium]
MAVPIRSCIACRKRENWTDLLRVVKVDGQVLPDPLHHLPGRGAWLHRKCFDTAKQRSSFARAFRSDEPLSTEELAVFIIGQ